MTRWVVMLGVAATALTAAGCGADSGDGEAAGSVDTDAGTFQLSLDEAASFADYPVFSAGPVALGETMDPAIWHVRHAVSPALQAQGIDNPVDDVSINHYGTCDSSESSCAPPVAVQSSLACAAYLATFDFGHEPGSVTDEMQRVDVGGDALAVLAGDGQVRVFTGDAVIAVFAETQAKAVDVARTLQPVNASAKASVGTDGALAAPSEQALTGKGC